MLPSFVIGARWRIASHRLQSAPSPSEPSAQIRRSRTSDVARANRRRISSICAATRSRRAESLRSSSVCNLLGHLVHRFQVGGMCPRRPAAHTARSRRRISPPHRAGRYVQPAVAGSATTGQSTKTSTKRGCSGALRCGGGTRHGGADRDHAVSRQQLRHTRCRMCSSRSSREPQATRQALAHLRAVEQFGRQPAVEQPLEHLARDGRLPRRGKSREPQGRSVQ